MERKKAGNTRKCDCPEYIGRPEDAIGFDEIDASFLLLKAEQRKMLAQEKNMYLERLESLRYPLKSSDELKTFGFYNNLDDKEKESWFARCLAALAGRIVTDEAKDSANLAMCGFSNSYDMDRSVKHILRENVDRIVKINLIMRDERMRKVFAGRGLWMECGCVDPDPDERMGLLLDTTQKDPGLYEKRGAAVLLRADASHRFEMAEAYPWGDTGKKIDEGSLGEWMRRTRLIYREYFSELSAQDMERVYESIGDKTEREDPGVTESRDSERNITKAWEKMFGVLSMNYQFPGDGITTLLKLWSFLKNHATGRMRKGIPYGVMVECEDTELGKRFLKDLAEVYIRQGLLFGGMKYRPEEGILNRTLNPKENYRKMWQEKDRLAQEYFVKHRADGTFAVGAFTLIDLDLIELPGDDTAGEDMDTFSGGRRCEDRYRDELKFLKAEFAGNSSVYIPFLIVNPKRAGQIKKHLPTVYGRLFPHHLILEPKKRGTDELVSLITNRLHQTLRIPIDDGYYWGLKGYLAATYRQSPLDVETYVDELVNDTITAYYEEPDPEPKIMARCVPHYPKRLYLTDLAGMKELRQALEEIRGRYLLNMRLSSYAKNPPSPILNMVITGNTGTGKSTAGPVIENELFRMGVLGKDKCIILSAYELSGERSAEYLEERIAAAGGGVLFLDDAHELKGKDTVIRRLWKAMQTDTDVIFIIAGRSGGMEELRKDYPEFATRIGYRISFEDPGTDILTEICDKCLSRAGFSTVDDAKKAIAERMSHFKAMQGFTNGYFALYLADRTLEKRSKSSTGTEIAFLRNISVRDIPSVSELEKAMGCLNETADKKTDIAESEE